MSSGWQPMDTAQKDGRWLWLLLRFDAVFRHFSVRDPVLPTPVPVATWGRWVEGEGWAAQSIAPGQLPLTGRVKDLKEVRFIDEPISPIAWQMSDGSTGAPRETRDQDQPAR